MTKDPEDGITCLAFTSDSRGRVTSHIARRKKTIKSHWTTACGWKVRASETTTLWSDVYCATCRASVGDKELLTSGSVAVDLDNVAHAARLVAEIDVSDGSCRLVQTRVHRLCDTDPDLPRGCIVRGVVSCLACLTRTS